MRLSTAIREGAKLHPQGFHIYRTFDREKGELRATCALGAAIVATGIDMHDLKKTYPVLTGHGPVCPQCGTRERGWTVHGVVAHLNDFHEWPRERIADWIATIEPAEAA